MATNVSTGLCKVLRSSLTFYNYLQTFSWGIFSRGAHVKKFQCYVAAGYVEVKFQLTQKILLNKYAI